MSVILIKGSIFKAYLNLSKYDVPCLFKVREIRVNGIYLTRSAEYLLYAKTERAKNFHKVTQLSSAGG